MSVKTPTGLLVAALLVLLAIPATPQSGPPGGPALTGTAQSTSSILWTWGLGAPDVTAATRALQNRGVVFVDRGPVQPSEKGALTQVYLGAVTFELVVSHLKP